MYSIDDLSDKTVNVAIRILGGEKPSDIKMQPIGFASPKYDWREMQRWGISENNLPPGSAILFREPGMWERYSWQLSLIACVILIQGGLIGGLLPRTASPPSRRSRIPPTPGGACTPQPLFGRRRTDDLDRA
jgi:hypothetical protein